MPILPQSYDHGMAAWCRGSPRGAQDSLADLLPVPPTLVQPSVFPCCLCGEAQPSSQGQEGETDMSGEGLDDKPCEGHRIQALPSGTGFQLEHSTHASQRPYP